MGFSLLIQSILVSTITGLSNYNFWYSYVLFIVIVGGLLVLFIYMTRVASNEKFKYSLKILVLVLIFSMIATIILVILDKFIIYQDIINLETLRINNEKEWTISLNKFSSYPSNIIIVFLIIYLLVALIAIVKITRTSEGPLRQKF